MYLPAANQMRAYSFTTVTRLIPAAIEILTNPCQSRPLEPGAVGVVGGGLVNNNRFFDKIIITQNIDMDLSVVMWMWLILDTPGLSLSAVL